MVAQQEAIVGENNMKNVKNILMMIKGKRTKRARPLSPLALTMSTASGGSGSGCGSDDWEAVANSTVSKEEEDMAHCLILLAQGSNQLSKNNNKAIYNNGTTTSYECKTCNRTFPSFQALGGHRASHKKPKLLKDEYTLNDKNDVKVHECGTCGAEFSSGQALGGHMRRHRPIGTAPHLQNQSGAAAKPVAPVEQTVTVTRHNVLSLDLNLPAPEEEQFQRHFVFPSNDKTLVFTASSLMDCHY